MLDQVTHSSDSPRYNSIIAIFHLFMISIRSELIVLIQEHEEASYRP